MEEDLAKHNNLLHQFLFHLKLLQLHNLMFISHHSQQLGKPEKWRAAYLISTPIHGTIWAYKLFHRLNLLHFQCSTIWPWPSSTQSLTKKQQDPLNPCVTAAANNSCNFTGLILRPCHKCSCRQERIILLQAAWQERWQPTPGFHVCPRRRLCSKYILAQAWSGCHIKILHFLSLHWNRKVSLEDINAKSNCFKGIGQLFFAFCFLPFSWVPDKKIDPILWTVWAVKRKGRTELAHR